MLRSGLKSLSALAIVLFLCTCIDPYSPKLSGYASLLVVDGLVTDANSSYSVRLSRTFQEQTGSSYNISDAEVSISDEAGTINDLHHAGNGIYKTDSLTFRGAAGKTYILHIHTHEGEEYQSEPCLMQSVADVDNVYFSRDQEFTNNMTQTQEGVSIFLDSKEGDIDQYYRWAFTETWKYKVPNPKRFNFNPADSSITLVSDVKEYCWKSRKSTDILIRSIYSGEINRIKRQPICFIAADKSDRLLLQYSILVNQYSISKKEYDFWNNLRQVNESGSDIFAKQPFTVISNINNINNPGERVLGYFQVSAVKEKRMNISFNDIKTMNLPLYHYPCERIIKSPADFQKVFGPKITWDYVYGIYCVTSDYYFVEPIYAAGATTSSKASLEKMVFARPECANCELTGTRQKPDYWVELN
jgi:hypothetical protein